MAAGTGIQPFREQQACRNRLCIESTLPSRAQSRDLLIIRDCNIDDPSTALGMTDPDTKLKYEHDMMTEKDYYSILNTYRDEGIQEGIAKGKEEGIKEGFEK